MSRQTLARLVLFALPLGLDTLAVSTALGVTPMPVCTRLRFAGAFALFEGAMPAIGLLLGTSIGRWSSYVAGAFVIVVGLWLWYHASKEGEDEAKQIQCAINRSGWALIAIALTVSLDELAIGFSFGLLRIPIVPALIVIAAQALLVSLLGAMDWPACGRYHWGVRRTAGWPGALPVRRIVHRGATGRFPILRRARH